VDEDDRMIWDEHSSPEKINRIHNELYEYDIYCDEENRQEDKITKIMMKEVLISIKYPS
jgi:hypothetical protein